MTLLGDGIWGWIQAVASTADQLFIVSPFFSINSQLKSLLKSVPRLQLVVGDEFSTNNPRDLEALAALSSTDVRCIYAEPDGTKRLHAKVFYATDARGRRQALIGSANFTVSGLSRNIEHAVAFDSDCETDAPVLDQIKRWIDKLRASASDIDWERAKEQYEKSPNPSFPIRDFDSYLRSRARNYWVLKTTEGSHGISRWDEFVNERVISVGWNDIVEIVRREVGIQPREYLRETLTAAAETWAAGEKDCGDPTHAAKILHWFCQEVSQGDRVIVCRGYAANREAAVRLYGLAIVDGDPFYDSDSNWWRLKRSAVIRRIETDVDKDVFVNAIERKSLLQTMHWIDKSEYEEFSRRIQDL